MRQPRLQMIPGPTRLRLFDQAGHSLTVDVVQGQRMEDAVFTAPVPCLAQRPALCPQPCMQSRRAQAGRHDPHAVTGTNT